LSPKGPFDLRRLAGFGFGPETGRPEATEPVMRLAFCLDDLDGHAGVVLRQGEDGVVRGELQSDGEPSAVTAQVARILSLDHDGEAWLAVGEREPVIGELQRRYPGLRPPLFNSPYEAAACKHLGIVRPAVVDCPVACARSVDASQPGAPRGVLIARTG
jgi:DNA-3-methyladenine glycosylase II